MDKNTIEKGKWQVGMVKHAKDGNDYRCTGFNAKGDPLWSKVNKKQGAGDTSAPATVPQGNGGDDNGGSNTAPAETKPTSTETKPAETKPAEKPSYDAPTPKVTYKTKAPAPEIKVQVPETWERLQSNGTKANVKRQTWRDIMKKKTDAELVDSVNNQKGNFYIRQLAYEEAAARGIDENKLDVSGGLQKWWNKLKKEYDITHPTIEVDENEENANIYDSSALDGMDVAAFMAQFPEGDTGWAEREDPRVKKEFHNFVSLSDRQRYDAFIDSQKREDEFYLSPEGQLNELKRQLFFFLKSNKSPMFVSAGGAGAGKTTGFLTVADAAAASRFDPKVHTPGSSGYNFVIVDKDIEDEKEFRELLLDHNGKTLVFDDKDKLLTSTASAIVSLMKSLADGNPSMRVFKNPKTGKQEKFTGKLLFITNKTMDTLQKDEDHKAIMSRASKSDIHFTINENIEILRNRYKTMGGTMEFVSSPQEEADIRQKLFDIIVENKSKLDPDKFTVRKFTEALDYIDAIESTNKEIEGSDAAAALFGDKKDWSKDIIRIFNKAEEDELEKALPPFTPSKKFDTSLMTEESKKDMIALYKKDPKKFIDLFGEEFLPYLGIATKKNEKEIKKAFTESLSGMTLKEAEDILNL